MTDRERIGRLIIDSTVTDSEASELTFAIQRDTVYHAERETSNRIDVYRQAHDNE